MALPESESRSIPPPVGRLADVQGRRMHIWEMGEGLPAVVMEAAIWDFSLSWALVLPATAKFTRAVAYDRAGLGWSDASPERRTARSMTAECRALLTAAGIPLPVVLVGHSFAALPVLLHAFIHPEEVAGIVLVDAAHEDQYQRYPKPIQEAFKPMQDMQTQYLLQLKDQIAARGPETVSAPIAVPARMPEETARLYKRLAIADVTRVDTMIAELNALDESQAQIRAARRATLGDLPMIVLRHGQPQSVPGMPDEVNRDYERCWQNIQAEHAALSSNSRVVVAENSGHMIHHDQPDLVVDAIRRVVESARSGAAV